MHISASFCIKGRYDKKKIPRSPVIDAGSEILQAKTDVRTFKDALREKGLRLIEDFTGCPPTTLTGVWMIILRPSLHPRSRPDPPDSGQPQRCARRLPVLDEKHLLDAANVTTELAGTMITETLLFVSISALANDPGRRRPRRLSTSASITSVRLCSRRAGSIAQRVLQRRRVRLQLSRALAVPRAVPACLAPEPRSSI
jgi:hypothetical protein